MAFDAKQAERVRNALGHIRGTTEKKMFGGLAFLHHGNMCCGVLDDKLVVRIGPNVYDAALEHKHTQEPARGHDAVSIHITHQATGPGRSTYKTAWAHRAAWAHPVNT
ncbi:MAG: hypothetical protein BMS9Abin22_554 [Gammaproteobacteria bacterium]|nr:MAG: hypothetical protein BMS9Abin22_554 [Gammaproteobacteria bacterium]